MHHIESVSEGRVVGWAAADASGCPAKVTLTCKQGAVGIFASRPREDVLAAGYSLFSGFDLEVSSDCGNEACALEVGGERRTFSPSTLLDQDIIMADTIRRRDQLSGWIRHISGLKSLIFHSRSGLFRASVFSRLDVNEALNTDPSALHGFEISNVDLLSVYAVSINSSHVHWCGQSLQSV